MKNSSACSTTKFFSIPWLSVNRSSLSFVAAEMMAEICDWLLRALLLCHGKTWSTMEKRTHGQAGGNPRFQGAFPVSGVWVQAARAIRVLFSHQALQTLLDEPGNHEDSCQGIRPPPARQGIRCKPE